MYIIRILTVASVFVKYKRIVFTSYVDIIAMCFKKQI